MKSLITRREQSKIYKRRVELISGKIPKVYKHLVFELMPELTEMGGCTDLVRNVRNGKSAHEGITVAFELIVQDLELKEQIQENEKSN